MSSKDWTALFKQYKGQWVALAQDEVTVISSGKSVKEVRTKALEAGYDKPILFKVPKKMIA